MELSIDELRPNTIVHIVIDGTAHFSVIREITEGSVKLSDPKLGNIEMTRERFSEIFTGHALVISNPNVRVSGTDQTNQSTEDTESEDTDSGELEKLTAEEIQSIIGKCGGLSIVAAVAAIKTAIKASGTIKTAKAIWKGTRHMGRQRAAWEVAMFLRGTIPSKIRQFFSNRVIRAVFAAALVIGRDLDNGQFYSWKTPKWAAAHAAVAFKYG